MLKIRKSLFLFWNEDYRHGKKAWTRIVEMFDTWKIIYFCPVEKPYILGKILNIWQTMNNDFHNISKFLAKFWYVFLRKFEFLTKRVCGRIDTFSMSGRLKHLKRRILLQQVLPREKSPFYSYGSKYNVRNRLFNKPLGHSFLDKVANICFARSQNNEKWS